MRASCPRRPHLLYSFAASPVQLRMRYFSRDHRTDRAERTLRYSRFIRETHARATHHAQTSFSCSRFHICPHRREYYSYADFAAALLSHAPFYLRRPASLPTGLTPLPRDLTPTQAAFLAGHCGAASSSSSDTAGPRRALKNNVQVGRTRWDRHWLCVYAQSPAGRPPRVYHFHHPRNLMAPSLTLHFLCHSSSR